MRHRAWQAWWDASGNNVKSCFVISALKWCVFALTYLSMLCWTLTSITIWMLWQLKAKRIWQNMDADFCLKLNNFFFRRCKSHLMHLSLTKGTCDDVHTTKCMIMLCWTVPFSLQILWHDNHPPWQAHHTYQPSSIWFGLGLWCHPLKKHHLLQSKSF